MLCLGRRVGESIVCITGHGERIEFFITSVPRKYSDGQVRVGIHAPLSVRIMRSELEQSKQNAILPAEAACDV